MTIETQLDAVPSAGALELAVIWMQNSGRGDPYERKLAAMFDAFAARARDEAIEECAQRCDAAAEDYRAFGGIKSDPESHSFGLAAKSFDEAAAFIRALNQKESPNAL